MQLSESPSKLPESPSCLTPEVFKLDETVEHENTARESENASVSGWFHCTSLKQGRMLNWEFKGGPCHDFTLKAIMFSYHGMNSCKETMI